MNMVFYKIFNLKSLQTLPTGNFLINSEQDLAEGRKVMV